MELDRSEGGRARGGRAALSPAGEARREAMLRGLVAEVARRRRRRAALRRGALAAAACVLVAGVLLEREADVTRTPAHAPEAARVKLPAPPPIVLVNARLEVVRDTAGIFERAAVADRPIPPSRFTDDESLLAALAEAERPAGLIRFAGGVVLAYHGRPEPPPEEAPPGDGL